MVIQNHYDISPEPLQGLAEGTGGGERKGEKRRERKIGIEH